MPSKMIRCRMNHLRLPCCAGKSINAVRGTSWFYQTWAINLSDGTAETVADGKEGSGMDLLFTKSAHGGNELSAIA